MHTPPVTTSPTLSSLSTFLNTRITVDQFTCYARAYLARRDELVSSRSAAAAAAGPLSWLTYARGWTFLPAVVHSSGTVFRQTACLERSFGVVVRPPHAGGSGGRASDDVASASQIDTPASSAETTRASILPEQEDTASDQAAAGVELVTVHQTICHSATWGVPVLWFHAYRSSGESVDVHELVALLIVHRQGTLPLHPAQESLEQQRELQPEPGCESDDGERERHEDAKPALSVGQTEPISHAKDDAYAAAGGDGGGGGISIADHPRTGLPSYYLHPCNTHRALSDLLSPPPPPPPPSSQPTHHTDTQEIQAAQMQQQHEQGHGWRYMCAFLSLCASAVEMRA